MAAAPVTRYPNAGRTRCHDNTTGLRQGATQYGQCDQKNGKITAHSALLMSMELMSENATRDRRDDDVNLN